MIYQFPRDVAKFVAEEMNARGYGSEDEVLHDALHVLRELRHRESQLIAEVKVGIEEADGGLCRALDLEALIDRCTQQLAKEGISPQSFEAGSASHPTVGTRDDHRIASLPSRGRRVV